MGLSYSHLKCILKGSHRVPRCTLGGLLNRSLVKKKRAYRVPEIRFHGCAVFNTNHAFVRTLSPVLLRCGKGPGQDLGVGLSDNVCYLGIVR